MPSFNRVILMGNLTRDPLLKNVGGTVCVEFGIAVNRSYTKDGQKHEEVCFVDCTAWGKQGELIAESMQKGRPIFVEGRLKYDSWEDKAGGKRSKLSVTVEGFQYIDRKPETGNAAERAINTGNRQPVAVAAGAPFGEEQQFRPEDIPF